MKTNFPFSFRKLQAIFIASFLLQTVAHSQTTTPDYDYAAFRFPDIDRKALDVQFDLLGSASKREERQVFMPENISNSSISNNLSFNYSRFRNTETLQSQQSLSFSESFFSRRTRTSTFLARETILNLGIGIDNVHRKYYKPLRFWEIDLFATAGFQRSRRRDDNVPVNKRSDLTLIGSLPVKIGQGRIEPIDDVFIAKFMMDDLLENGLLSAPLSQEQLFSLGQVMAAARNQRIFDGRRQRIYELTQLDNWFKANGLAESKSDMLYFTTVADNWLFSFRNVRSAGARYAVGLEPFGRLRHTWEVGPGISEGYFGISAFGEYTHERPINQFWQLQKTAKAGIEYLINPVDPERDFYNQWLRPFAEAGLGYGYFPNSRTNLFANAALRYEYYHADPDNAFLFDYHVVQPSIDLQTTYFINYQFRLNGRLNSSYSWSSDNDEGPVFSSPGLPFSANSGNSRFNLFAQLTLNYSFF